MSGEVLQVEPGRRLVFTWGWETGGHAVPSGTSRVEIELAPQGKGTTLRLRHSLVPLDFAAKIERGWGHHLDRLAGIAARREPGGGAGDQ